jgi:DNA-binding response OmpR family regulator
MSVLLLTADLACSSQVTAAGARTGVAVEAAMNVARLLQRAAETAPRLVIVDLNTAGLDSSGLVQQLKQLTPPPTVIAFGPHVHEARLAAAREAGCDQVLARGQFYAHLDALLAGQISELPGKS